LNVESVTPWFDNVILNQSKTCLLVYKSLAGQHMILPSVLFCLDQTRLAFLALALMGRQA